MPPYADSADLLIGSIPTPDYLNKDKFMQDAADEIDSKIGFLYKTPVNMEETGPVVRPARLLLKRINAYLASGRLLMSVDAPAEDNTVHAYGASLIKEANAALNAIASGETRLEGAEAAEGASPTSGGPLINNLDPESNVEAFYNRAFTQPGSYVPGTRVAPALLRW